jgi:predicted porin
MKKYALPLALLSGLSISGASHATDWITLQGTEPANASTAKIWGFLQPTYTYINSEPVTGLQGAAATYNNHQQISNLVGPDLDSTQNIQLFRARLGMRGILRPIDDRINYFVLLEAGRNGLTREQNVVFSDASMTFNYIPGMHLRAGLFKLPTGEEALTAVQVAYNYVNYTSVTDGLLNERDMTPKAAIPGTPAGLSAGSVMGSLSGFRDFGIEAFNTFRKDRWEFGYAAMVSNGNNINFIRDNNSSKDFTGRLQVSYIFNGAGPMREDANAYIWHQQGKRTFGSTDYNRMREGTGFKYLKDKLRFSGEYMRGAGMIYNGPNPPFVDIPTDSTPAPVDTIALQDYNTADGWYLEGGYRFLPKWGVNLKYDEYHRLTNIQQAANQRNFKTWTIGGEYFMSKTTHFTMTYEIRKAEVANPGASGFTAATLNNAEIIANNLGNRFSLEMTFNF